MMIGRRMVHLLAFTGMAVVVALSVDRVVQPSVTRDLVLTAGLAVAVGLPGLIGRRLSPLALITVPLGLYLLLRLAGPLPETIDGWQAQWGYYTEQLRFGMAAYAEDIFPLSLGGVPGLQLLVLVAVYVVIALASVLALDGQHPLAGVGVLLSFMAVGLTVDGDATDTLLVAAFVLAAAFLLLTSHGLSRRHWGLRDAVVGLAVGGAGLLIAYFLLSSSPGIAVQGWQDWRSWDPFGRGPGERVAFTWNLNYPRLLDPGREVPVFKVTSPLPVYWRAETLELFNGRSWVTAGQPWIPVGEGPGTLPLPPAEPTPPGEMVTERFVLDQLTTTILFAGGSPAEVMLRQPTRLYASIAGALHTETPVEPPYEYAVNAIVPRMKPAELVGLGRAYPAGLEFYQALPLPTAADVTADPGLLQRLDEEAELFYRGTRFDREEFKDIYRLNERVLQGASDPYEQTIRIERYLRGAFQYSTDIPASRYESPIAAFLFDSKTGYCQHFAGAMALLLRLNGIPSRVAVGFTTGELVDEHTYQVTSNNAHAWVEVYFPGVGWLPFDPTPGRALPPGASASSPGFVDPFPHETGATTPTTAFLPPTRGGGADPGVDTGGSSSTGGGGWAPVAPLMVLFVVVATIAGWPPARRRIRERGLRRGDPGDRLRAALDLLRRDLADGALRVTPATTLTELADQLHIQQIADLRSLIERAEAVLFGGRTATTADVAALVSARHDVAVALRTRNGRLWWILSLYGLASVVWRVRRQWQRLLSARTGGARARAAIEGEV